LVGWNAFIKNKRPIDLNREVFRIESGRLLDYSRGDGDEIVLIIPSLVGVLIII
jgi:hypothetical protein